MKNENLFVSDVQELTVYALLSEVSRQLDAEIAKLCDNMRLQSGARRILACLDKRDGVSQLELVRATHLKAPTISLIVQKMERDGLITRRSDDIDMRLTRVQISDEGKRVNEILAQSIRDIEDKAFNEFSDHEKKTFKSMLARIYANMEEADKR